MTSKHACDCDGDIDESTYLKLKALLCGTNVSISEYNLEDFDGKISLSVDKLEKQELMRTHDFLCVSLHFIDGSWNLKKWAVKCCSIDETYGVEPLKVIADSIKEWDIKDKIGSVTLDPEWDAEETNDIKKHVEQQKLLLNGRLFRVNCVADCICLVVQSLFNEIRSTVFKIRKLCPTRSEPALWYARNSNLKQALKMWSEGKFASTKGNEVPSAEEWKWVKVVCETVDKIYKVAKALFHREDVTANLFLYHIDEILEILSGFSVGSSETFFGLELKERGLSMLNDYRKDTFLVLGIATVLDPRLKMKYIEFTCSKSWGDGNASALQPETVSDAIRNLYDDYAALFPTVAQSGSSTSASAEQASSLAVIREYDQFIKLSGVAKSELDRYLEEPVEPWSEDFAVLNWWKEASTARYPVLSRIARDILAIPLSLATLDEAFYSFVRRPVDVRLEPICTQSWYDDEY